MQPQPDLPELLYISDPLCAWCYGMSPVIEQVQQQFGGRLDVSVLCGGMFTGEQVGSIGPDWPLMSGALQQVAQVTGAEFGAAFRALGQEGSYVQDSAPPCRAIHAFRQLRQEQAARFAHQVQRAYFHEGANLNEPATYDALVAAFGIEPAEFRQRLSSPEVIRGTELEFAAVGKIGVQGFPTSILRVGSQGFVLARGFQPYEAFVAGLEEALHQAGHEG
ncbi:DsbA family protein [Hymenobacter rubripertinctus]|uniref:DsbA family protein n=1 Tax=Hymenobacter rubripertinctus TaxID=2029981 RepID=A0A418R2U1_9BACT|nr:DsbA family protein [Hymenobacter rubripertinctus]RIY11850.1 DsbA family protein [Hymenobacter rubripertinctus]